MPAPKIAFEPQRLSCQAYCSGMTLRSNPLCLYLPALKRHGLHMRIALIKEHVTRVLYYCSTGAACHNARRCPAMAREITLVGACWDSSLHTLRSLRDTDVHDATSLQSIRFYIHASMMVTSPMPHDACMAPCHSWSPSLVWQRICRGRSSCLAGIRRWQHRHLSECTGQLVSQQVRPGRCAKCSHEAGDCSTSSRRAGQREAAIQGETGPIKRARQGKGWRRMKNQTSLPGDMAARPR